MRLHHGTVWRWNRPVYDRAGGGHLRIELRALPAGPSVIDMAANAAFLLGLTLALRERIDPLIAALPFAYAEHNFYRAAQRGLEADLLWPHETAPSPRPRRASGLVRELLPAARAALVGAGVDSDEVDLHLSVIERRAASGQTGARWQRQAVRSLDRTEPRPRALARMVETYLAHSQANLPVHEWPLER
jgi:gamma-glutamyl:cysteine ligase YbdK (ATP-grasp superfamily)